MFLLGGIDVPVLVRVLDAQDELTAVSMRVRHVEKGHVGRADVGISGRRRGNPQADGASAGAGVADWGVTHVRGPRFGRCGAGRAERG